MTFEEDGWTNRFIFEPAFEGPRILRSRPVSLTRFIPFVLFFSSLLFSVRVFETCWFSRRGVRLDMAAISFISAFGCTSLLPPSRVSEASFSSCSVCFSPW